MSELEAEEKDQQGTNSVRWASSTFFTCLSICFRYHHVCLHVLTPPFWSSSPYVCRKYHSTACGTKKQLGTLTTGLTCKLALSLSSVVFRQKHLLPPLLHATAFVAVSANIVIIILHEGVGRFAARSPFSLSYHTERMVCGACAQNNNFSGGHFSHRKIGNGRTK